MTGRKSLIWTSACLIVILVIAGCASPSTPPPVQPPLPTTKSPAIPQITIEATPVPVRNAGSTISPVGSVREKEILHDMGTLTKDDYKTYDFKDLGFKFIYPGDKFRITIKSEEPVLGYALNTEQASGLQGTQLIPRYESYSTKVQWGLIEPSFVMEKATNSTGEFVYGDYVEYRYDGDKYIAMNMTTGEVHPLTYVVDGRWMSYDPTYDNVRTYTYEITITKTGGPTEQSFNF
jgi:hypothetical protein